MTDDKAAPPAAAGETHEWHERFNLTCCSKCGIVRRADGGTDAKQCPGVVGVELRAPPAAAGEYDGLIDYFRQHATPSGRAHDYNTAADALAAMQAERERTMSLLADPIAVRVNVLRGQIALPNDLVWLHAEHGPVADLRHELSAAQARIATLTEALRKAAPHVCSLLCPSVKREGEAWVHVPLCNDIVAALNDPTQEERLCNCGTAGSGEEHEPWCRTTRAALKGGENV